MSNVNLTTRNSLPYPTLNDIGWGVDYNSKILTADSNIASLVSSNTFVKQNTFDGYGVVVQNFDGYGVTIQKGAAGAVGPKLFLYNNISNASVGHATEILMGSSSVRAVHIRSIATATDGKDPKLVFSVDTDGVGESDKLTMLNSGYLGVGVTVPLGKLHVSNDQDAISDFYLTNSRISSTFAAGARLYVGDNDLSNYVSIGNSLDSTTHYSEIKHVSSSSSHGFIINSTTATGPLVFKTNNAEVARVTYEGKFGIGTTSPNVLVEAYSTTLGSAVLRVNNAVTNGTPELQLYGLGGNGTDITIGKIGVVSTASNPSSDMVFSVRSLSGTTYERMRIVSTGDVGIGTTSPTSRLNVEGGSGGVDDEGLRVSGTFSDQTAHPMRVASTHPLTTGKAVAFYDARGFITGTASTDHAVGYQCDITNSSTGTMSNFYGIYVRDVLSSGASVTNRYGIYVNAIANSGTIANNYGLYIAPVVGGTVLNYNIYASGAAASYLGGYLGIGTASPSTSLDISQAQSLVRLQSTTTSNWNGVGFITHATSTYWHAAIVEAPTTANLHFKVGGASTTAPEDLATRMMIDYTTGNVGVGTTSPRGVLDVNGKVYVGSVTDDSDKACYIIFSQYDSGTETEGWQPIYGYSNATNNEVTLGGGSTVHNAATTFRVFTAATPTTRTGTERMRITADGYAGFGTTPSKHFEVAATAALDGTDPATIRLTDLRNGTGWTTGGKSAVLEFYSTDASTPGTGVVAQLATVVTTTAGGVKDFIISTRDDVGTLDERLRVRYSGLVGIGSPSSLTNRLVVKNSTTDLAAIAIERSGGAQQVVRLGEDASGHGVARVLDNGQNDKVWLAASGTSYLTGGNVGIGASSLYEYSGLEVVSANAINYFGAHVHIRNATATTGMFLASTGSTVGIMSVGAHYNNTGSYLAKTTTAAIVYFSAGNTVFCNDTGLTSGTTFVPTERMRITADGYTGLGTSTPTVKLEVYQSGAGNSNLLLLNRNTAASNDETSIKFKASTFEQAEIAAVQQSTSTDADLVFKTNTVGGTSLVEQMRIKHDGKIGIGTTGPLGRVEVAKSAADSDLFVSTWSTTVDDAPKIIGLHSKNATVGGLTTTDADTRLLVLYGQGVNGAGARAAAASIEIQQDAYGATYIPGRITFSTGTTTGTITERMRIDTNGNLLIGRTTAASVNSVLTIERSATNTIGTFSRVTNTASTGDGSTTYCRTYVRSSAGSNKSIDLLAVDESAGSLSGLCLVNVQNASLAFSVGTSSPSVKATIDSSGNFLLAYSGSGTSAYQYIGNATTDGSWRWYTDGTDLIFERRVSGTWTEKTRITN